MPSGRASQMQVCRARLMSQGGAGTATAVLRGPWPDGRNGHRCQSGMSSWGEVLTSKSAKQPCRVPRAGRRSGIIWPASGIGLGRRKTAAALVASCPCGRRSLSI